MNPSNIRQSVNLADGMPEIAAEVAASSEAIKRAIESAPPSGPLVVDLADVFTLLRADALRLAKIHGMPVPSIVSISFGDFVLSVVRSGDAFADFAREYEAQAQMAAAAGQTRQ